MEKFGSIRATAKANAYLGSIATAMAETYSIPRDEAVTRISQLWAGLTFLTKDEVGLLTHEGPDYWAEVVYSGGRK